MRVIVAADIHGVSAELRSLIEPVVGEAVFLSPWETDACPYADEQDAVREFIANIGFESYARRIALKANREPAYIVGFSVGASAAWLHSASSGCHPESEATLFYGSRIRDYVSLVPRIGVTAVFAESEPSFSPAQLARAIARDKVRSFVEPGTFHGFMNPRSANYAPTHCRAHLRALAAELARFRLRAGHLWSG